MLPLEDTVARTIARYQLASLGQPIYIALSGGTDSVALLRAMSALGYELRALHCNFTLRAAESDADEQFVRALCDAHAISLQVQRYDTERYAREHGISIEMAARELRYTWFTHILAEHPEAQVAMAHNADDQIETMLLNLSMGTGIRGLSGMPYRREDRIIRPLMDCSRREIEVYLRSLGQASREDSSNSDEVYRRNYIRHSLIPAFEAINPSFRQSTGRTIEHLRGVEAVYLSAVEVMKQSVMPRAGCMDIERLMATPHPETVLYELLRPYGFSSEQCHAIAQSLPDLPSGRQFLSPSHRLIRSREVLELGAINREGSEVISLNIAECSYIDLPIGRLSWETGAVESLDNLRCAKYEAIFSLDKLGDTLQLSIRPRREGDSLAPYGMQGRKKLRRIFIDGHFSHQERECALLLCHDNQPIWLIGHIADRTYAIDTRQGRYIKFRLTPKPDLV
ncbi:MAG: tRNA lysidine(34) synthetase TilS [Porphyromonadaceae bacterium]|nr:tRNA lysidine(34) synthetase TilS [Porphyromonadaceae bacterium]